MQLPLQKKEPPHCLSKRRLLMHLPALLILLATCMQVNGKAQAQGVTMNVKGVSLKQAFSMIERQTGYVFFYKDASLENAGPVTVQLQNAAISLAVKTCLQGQPYEFHIEDKTVFITEKRESAAPPTLYLPPSPQDTVRGRITNEGGTPIPGTTVRVKGTQIAAISGDNGNFTLNDVPEHATLVISSIGYAPKEYKLDGSSDITISLAASIASLDSLAVTVSTGYQEIPKERATGSFDFIDNKLLNRSVSTNILDRLDGVASSLIFNKNLPGVWNNSDITIRGRSTIFANPSPLIVVDNFEYDGDINNINPNDVESVTILKDAAAASIWGVRAGNGVIVITTKKGKYNEKPTINFNTSITVGGKPDLWYPRQMTSSEYIGLESYLFDKGYYNSTLLNDYQAITPAVALMQQRKIGQLTDKEYDSKISQLKQYDVRNDLYKYFYRTKVYQQYQLNFSGGNANQKYFISAGYDKNLENNVNNMYRRITVNANNTMNFWNNRISLFTGMTFTNSKTGTNSHAYRPNTPYDHIADDMRNALPVVDNLLQKFRESYVDTAGNGKLLDWTYKPMDERGPNRINNLNDYRLNSSLTIRPTDHFGVTFNYQYQKGNSDLNDYNDENSFYTRNLINQYTQIDWQTGNVSRVIPIGAIVSKTMSGYTSQTGRVQANYDYTLHDGSELNFLAGFEAKQYKTELFTNTLYGYNEDNETNENGTINPNQYYPLYYSPNRSGIISTSPGQIGTTDNYRSWYANGSFSYLGRYIISASARRDESNIFGVKPNQKGVPLWSAGIAWDITKEPLFNVPVFSELKLRGSYGYNGNVDKSTSAYLMTQTSFPIYWGNYPSEVRNPPNPSLRWEKIRNINLGLDFTILNNSVAGNIEYYSKQGTDLIANSPIAPQTGISTFKGNSADMLTKGLDVDVNIKLMDRAIRWDMNLLYNFTKNRITSYKQKQPSNSQIIANNDLNPLVGYPYYSIFAFKWGGLDGEGNPQGYLNGKLSEDYSSIYRLIAPSQLIFEGSGTPTTFGSIRNTFQYKQFSLSFNLLYKLGYYIRKSYVFNGSSYTYQQSGYDKRWQKPGDENVTNIPSLVYPVNYYRNLFFSNSEVLVDKGDHIRLQDIRLSYTFSNRNKIPAVSLYCYAQNVGILWRANKDHIDPDYGTTLLPTPTSYSFGANLNF